MRPIHKFIHGHGVQPVAVRVAVGVGVGAGAAHRRSQDSFGHRVGSPDYSAIVQKKYSVRGYQEHLIEVVVEHREFAHLRVDTHLSANGLRCCYYHPERVSVSARGRARHLQSSERLPTFVEYGRRRACPGVKSFAVVLVAGNLKGRHGCQGSADSIGPHVMLGPAGSRHEIDQTGSVEGILVTDYLHHPSPLVG